LSEAVGTEIFGNASDPVQALGFETESTARVCRPSRPENHFMKGLSLAVPSPEGWYILCRGRRPRWRRGVKRLEGADGSIDPKHPKPSKGGT